MKVAILAGGLGTRLGEETTIRPKPMVEIGGKPILWHIMKIYSYYGYNEFVVLCGYKQEYIKEYFRNYFINNSDVTFDLAGDSVIVHKKRVEPWKITLLDTGLNTLTGGRIKRAQEILGDAPFMLTYGDGVSDVDLAALVDFHKKHKRLATVTAVQPQGRFGVLDIDESSTIQSFLEKPRNAASAWINAGFFVLEPRVFDYITEGDKTIWERTPLTRLARAGELKAYKHEGFWHPMDMPRDKVELNELWASGSAPWKVWED
ncbi:glucose-1-phosphate cytidylyltransferase [uncultured Mailhella sp.]|uniref:glucose-1-phosphate cytidylyltransferase n=1 Tax=uncultured Mailhella sp. TaxID=1981031 RepID=UPI002607E637|nr:glucose-1-phosphate cytidylyltransferase [uncultured Mailhella sp.]